MPAWTSRRSSSGTKRPRPGANALRAAKAAVFLAALIPLAKLSTGAVLGTLGANPIEKIIRTTGYWTLSFLLITLAVTPLRILLRQPWLVRLRRMLGLFAFFYGTLHFTGYLVLDQFFDWPAILKDIAKRPFITVGFPSFVLLIPLAVTSTDAMMRRLGGKRWQRLHRLVYVSAAGGVIHYLWLVKKDISDPLRFATLLTVLLGFRAIVLLRRRVRAVSAA
ncbi:sulfoxide reductase heme-binding subunit YedZ [Methylococcus geothermalis]|uniref:Protein-methionine-sulfoxide reductase heme-binding subunit MsrQ n=1 Tax=Methylococcus geothermalis TaxID=2681310 RepID=A0A858Q6B6_9GAMM|nr:sulfoxide reductase heme-binding subunit YedZ [Methylococcus geothermalis]